MVGREFNTAREPRVALRAKGTCPFRAWIIIVGSKSRLEERKESSARKRKSGAKVRPQERRLVCVSVS